MSRVPADVDTTTTSTTTSRTHEPWVQTAIPCQTYATSSVDIRRSGSKLHAFYIRFCAQRKRDNFHLNMLNANAKSSSTLCAIGVHNFLWSLSLSAMQGLCSANSATVLLQGRPKTLAVFLTYAILLMQANQSTSVIFCHCLAPALNNHPLSSSVQVCNILKSSSTPQQSPQSMQM